MRQRRGRFRRRVLALLPGYVLIVLCAGSVLLLTVLGIQAAASTLPSDAALRVEARLITVDDLNRRSVALRALYGINPPTEKHKSDQYRRALAKSIAIALIVEDSAARHNVIVSDQEVHDLYKKFIEGYPGGRDTFIRTLGQEGASENDVISEIRLQTLSERLFKEISKTAPPVTNADVQNTYDSEGARLTLPELRSIRNIVVSTEAQANALVQDLRSGTSFGDLAKKYSLDASTRDSGGDIGLVTAASLESAYASAAFAPSPGEFFGPVRTQYGWNVGEVTQVVPSRKPSLDEAASGIRHRLEAQHALDVWRRFLSSRLEAGDVQYAPAYRPANLDFDGGNDSPDGQTVR